MRAALYARRILTSVRLPVQVAVVGNLTVGGSGKTPLVLWLAQVLRDSGRNPGIVCRGHGGTRRGVGAVGPDSDPLLAGDEAVLLAERSSCPVWAGADRVRAAQGLLAEHPDCDLIVCDDGLQHYRLARDLEIAVEDERGQGNGLMLPAGPLREPAARPVDAWVINGERARREGAFRMLLEPAGLYRLIDPSAQLGIEDLRGKRLHAVAGIGHPARFFASLAALGLSATAHAFPDHHAYRRQDLDFPGCDAVLMTEKDAVKCRRFGRDDLYALRVTAKLDPAFLEFVRTRLDGLKTS